MSIDPTRARSAPVEKASGTQRFLAWAGMVVVVLATVFGARVSELIGFPLMLIPLALVGLIALFPIGGIGTWKRLARSVAPVAGFAVASMIVYFITASRFTGSHSTRSLVILIPFAWIAAAVLGFRSRVEGQRPLLVAGGSVMVLSLAAALSEIGHRSGLVTGFSRFYDSWNTAIGVAPTSRDWMIRSVGFEVDPNTFGLIGVLVLVIALTVPARTWTRWFLGVGALVMVALSGSRTVVAAVLLAVATYLVVGYLSKLGRSAPLRGKGLVVVSALVVLAALAFGVVVSQAGGSATGASSVVEESLSGRVAIWSRALSVYREQPAGLFTPPEAVLGMSVHNEYIERLMLGGPFLLAALLAFLVWMFARLRPESARALGPCLAVVYAAAAFTLGPSLLQAFTSLMFFTVGWGLAEQSRRSELDRPSAAVEGPDSAAELG